MIYIKRDATLIPAKVLAVAQRAQDALEQLPAEQRKGFIKKKSHIWRGFPLLVLKDPRHTRVSHATDRSQYLRPRFQPGGLFCSTSARNEHPPFLCRDRQAILALTDFVRELFGPETSGNTWIFPG